jgi:hypothetical protein
MLIGHAAVSPPDRQFPAVRVHMGEIRPLRCFASRPLPTLAGTSVAERDRGGAPDESVDPTEIERIALAEALFLGAFADTSS